MAFMFKIGNADFSDCVLMDGGFRLKRTDIDDEEAAGRSMGAGIPMHRARLGTKRSMTVRCATITQTRIQQLSSALSPTTISVTYTDFQTGNTTKTFYGTEIEAASGFVRGGVNYWRDGTFTLVEV